MLSFGVKLTSFAIVKDRVGILEAEKVAVWILAQFILVLRQEGSEWSASLRMNLAKLLALLESLTAGPQLVSDHLCVQKTGR